MSATIINLIIQLIAGALGGNAAGAASKDVSLGTLGNTIAGAIGGVGGGQLLTALIPMMAGVGNNVDIGVLASQAVGAASPVRLSRPSLALSRTRWPDSQTAPLPLRARPPPVWSAWAEGRHDRRRRVCLRQQLTATRWRRQLPSVQFNRSRRDAGALDRLAEASDGETVRLSETQMKADLASRFSVQRAQFTSLSSWKVTPCHHLPRTKTFRSNN